MLIAIIGENCVGKSTLANKINEKFDSIALFPKSAPLLNNDYVTNKNIRKLLIDNYIAFYEVDDIKNEIKNKHKVGDKMTLKVNRENKEINITLTLQEQ